MADEKVQTTDASAGPTSFAEAFNDYDFDWDNDDGELSISRTGSEEELEESGETELETEEEETETETDQIDDEPEPEAQENQWVKELEEKIARLERTLEEKSNEPTRQEATTETAVSDPLGDVIPEDADLAEIFSDVDQTKTLLKKAFTKMIEEVIAPHQQMLAHYQVQQEIQRAVKKYPDFQEKVPVIRDILAEHPNLDLDTAYRMASKFAPAKQASEANTKDRSEKTAESEKGTAGKEKPKPRLSAEEIKEKADSLKTEQGVSGKRSSGGAAASVQDAFNQALEEVLG